MHGTLKSVEGPPNLGISLPLSTKPTTQNSVGQNKEDSKSVNGTEKTEKKSPSPVKKAEPKKVPNPGWTCWECDRLFTQRDVYISHMRKEHGKVNKWLSFPMQKERMRRYPSATVRAAWHQKILSVSLFTDASINILITFALNTNFNILKSVYMYFISFKNVYLHIVCT